MPWVITRLCIDCLDTACARACPVDCIYEYTGPDLKTFPHQLYINPDECIDCSECEPKCPWQAIYPEQNVPGPFRDDIPLNAATGTIRGQFKVKMY
jgi:ferredoxin